MINALFIDFDGVIRHMDTSATRKIEGAASIPIGSLLREVFCSDHFQHAITGQYSHQEWLTMINADCRRRWGKQVANDFLYAFSNPSATIDYSLLTQIRNLFPHAKIVLVTNATDHLSQDLRSYGLDQHFDEVINSSEIRVAKPHPEFYQIALERAGVTATESAFIDDSAQNIETAKAMGFLGLHFSDSSSALETLKKLS